MAVRQGRSFWEETGNLEGRAAEAEERCAARAQEKLTACRARERAGGKRKYQNRLHPFGRDMTKQNVPMVSRSAPITTM